MSSWSYKEISNIILDTCLDCREIEEINEGNLEEGILNFKCNRYGFKWKSIYESTKCNNKKSKTEYKRVVYPHFVSTTTVFSEDPSRRGRVLNPDR